jgi:hypothetical protein
MASRNNQSSNASIRERLVTLDRTIEQLRNELAQAENEQAALPYGPNRGRLQSGLARRITQTRRVLNERIAEEAIVQRMLTHSLRPNFNAREVVHLPELLRRTRSRSSSRSRSRSRNSQGTRRRRCLKGRCTVS